ncbi:MAG: hypothetical protein V4621_02785 [Pseudomonadota bacterium]
MTYIQNLHTPVTTSPYNPLSPIYPIKILRGILTDPARNGREVAYKLYAPDVAPGTMQPQPLVIWSHGLGGGRDGAGFISRHLAARGYVALHIQHIGTDTSLWEGKPGHPWDVIRATPIPRKAVLQRYRDIPFVLSSLNTLESTHPEVAGLIDRGHIGLSGHSLGAMTTQIMAGQYGMRSGSRHSYDLHQPQIRAGILYSPIPLYRHPDKANAAYRGIRIPLFHMTGTQDDSPIGEFTHDLRTDIYTHAGHADQMLLVLKDGDHMVYNGSRGQLGDNPLREAHETSIIAATTAYWDAYLRDDAAARAWLLGDGLRAILAPEDVLRTRMT